MLRLFYLVLIAVVSVAATGCAGSAFLLAGGDAIADGDSDRISKSRSLDDVLRDEAEVEVAEDTLHVRAGASNQAPNETAVKSTDSRTAGAQAQIAGKRPTDVGAPGFGVPKEEAGALAALYVDPNAVAVLELEAADELPDVVHRDDRANDSRQDRRGNVPVRPAAARATREYWRDHLDRAIEALEDDLVHGGDNREDRRDRTLNDARLRLLYVLAERRDEALRPRSSGSTAEQEFWRQEIDGLATLLDCTKQPDSRKRAALAAGHLRQAAERIGELGGLAVKNLHFCTEVKGFGTFVSFAQDEFRPGQEVLLYCEIDHFTSKLTEQGYHTALKAQYQVFDASGKRVAERDLGLKEEHCRNRRRDFFVPYFLSMPKQVPAGKYQLKLTLEDVNSGRTAEGTIGFGIKEK